MFFFLFLCLSFCPSLSLPMPCSPQESLVQSEGNSFSASSIGWEISLPTGFVNTGSCAAFHLASLSPNAFDGMSVAAIELITLCRVEAFFRLFTISQIVFFLFLFSFQLLFNSPKLWMTIWLWICFSSITVCLQQSLSLKVHCWSNSKLFSWLLLRFRSKVQ